MATQRPASSARPEPELHPEILNTPRAARLLGVSPKTVLKLARSGELPGKKVGKAWLFRLQNVLRWLGEESPTSTKQDAPRSSAAEEAVVALVGMGYTKTEAETRVDRAYQELTTVDAIMHAALKQRSSS